MSPEEQFDLGTRIRRIREERGMKLSQLEDASGVTRGYLSQLENGKASNPSVEHMRKIAQGLGVNLVELLGEEAEAETTAAKLPKGLKEFAAEAKKRGIKLTENDIHMLSAIEYRGKKPRSAEQYMTLFEIIKGFAR